jgi:proteasome lid subunit RPN8/RPN11
MSLIVPKVIEEQVSAAGEKAFPEECCGFLIGKIPQGFETTTRVVTVEEARPLPNGWESGARTHRYQIDPRLFAKVEAELEGTGRGIVGFYHSHPSVPAWPSPFDLERAWPCYSYWIVCVREGRADHSRSWIRSEDGRDFIEEPVEVLDRIKEKTTL